MCAPPPRPAHRSAVAAWAFVVIAGFGSIPPDGTASDDPTDPRPALRNADGQNEEFSGVAQVVGLGLDCTAFLVDTGAPADAAIMLTNGHCVGLFDAVTTLTDTPAADGALARFRKFTDTLDSVVDVPITTVRYATMRATDVAVIELDATLASLIGQGIAAYELGPAPLDGDEIRVVGVPVTGIEPAKQVLRGDTCTAGATVRLVEFEWLWDAAVASDCAGILGGNSGSPAFAADDPSTVVAMVNTTTIGAGPGGSCYLGQPCEIGYDGEVEVENRTYAMPVEDWAACFAGAFETTAHGCPAEGAPSVRVEEPQRAAQPNAAWSATISADDWDGDVLVKSGQAGWTDCRDAEGYGHSRQVDESGLFQLPVLLPNGDTTPDGVYVLCAATADPTGVVARGSAGYALIQIDSTPPTLQIELRVVADPGGDAAVEPIFAVPEHSSFDVKVGPREETDCDDPDGYVVYRRIPIVVPADQRPATVCVIGEDEAGNRGAPQQFDVP